MFFLYGLLDSSSVLTSESHSFHLAKSWLCSDFCFRSCQKTKKPGHFGGILAARDGPLHQRPWNPARLPSDGLVGRVHLLYGSAIFWARHSLTECVFSMVEQPEQLVRSKTERLGR